MADFFRKFDGHLFYGNLLQKVQWQFMIENLMAIYYRKFDNTLQQEICYKFFIGYLLEICYRKFDSNLLQKI